MLEEKVKQHKPKLFFTQTLGHNPTGGCIALNIQYQILKLANLYDFYCVEIDPFADLFTPNTPRMAALDQLDKIIYIGTYSKVLSANFRIGYIAAKQDTIKSLTNIKMLTIVNSSEFMERWLHNIITHSQYLRHLRKLRSMIDENTQAAVQLYRQHGFTMPFHSEGSYYLWLELNEKINDIELSHLASEQSIFLAPGALFYPDKKKLST
ncbi:aminotransferase class I/II-fold pyridoxal phosphate-dependent enzyme, partial [Pelistega indica]|uniref:aminotransferase class I/II-fold pyridoxal phosphate-dependent enzyme n=1 Tax=Pelistega indica TaxID=1414851 RepID=UPI0011CB8188